MGRALALLLALTGAADAADKALILNDQEQRDLVALLDAATKAQGLAMAPQALRLYYKLQAAGVVTEQKTEPAEGKDAK